MGIIKNIDLIRLTILKRVSFLLIWKMNSVGELETIRRVQTASALK